MEDKRADKPQHNPPICHFTEMEYVVADDGCMQVEFWECKHCGHTIEVCRYLAG